MSDATTTETPVVEVYPALTELSTKTDILEHLRNVHGASYAYSKSITGDPKSVKVTKTQLLAAHNHFHQQVDEGGSWKWIERARYDQDTSTWMGALVPFNKQGRELVQRHGQIILPHTHADINESAELRAAAVAARTGGQISDKALPAGQLKLLTDIVRNDFRIIEQEMREFAAESLEARRKEIKDEYKGRNVAGPKYKKRADAAHEKLRETIKKLQEDAAEDGIDLQMAVPFTTASISIKGLNDALRAAEEENKAAITRALTRLEREKAVALRRVQLAGISADAVKLLDSLPDARQMMLESQTATAPKELE